MRKAIIPRLGDPHVKSALEYFDSLQERRQEELAASTVARLEGFIMDPQIRPIFTAPPEEPLEVPTWSETA